MINVNDNVKFGYLLDVVKTFKYNFNSFLWHILTYNDTWFEQFNFFMCQGIGNGLPLAAVVTTPEIANVMAQK